MTVASLALRTPRRRVDPPAALGAPAAPPAAPPPPSSAPARTRSARGESLWVRWRRLWSRAAPRLGCRRRLRSRSAARRSATSRPGRSSRIRRRCRPCRSLGSRRPPSPAAASTQRPGTAGGNRQRVSSRPACKRLMADHSLWSRGERMLTLVQMPSMVMPTPLMVELCASAALTPVSPVEPKMFSATFGPSDQSHRRQRSSQSSGRQRRKVGDSGRTHRGRSARRLRPQKHDGSWFRRMSGEQLRKD